MSNDYDDKGSGFGTAIFLAIIFGLLWAGGYLYWQDHRLFGWASQAEQRVAGANARDYFSRASQRGAQYSKTYSLGYCDASRMDGDFILCTADYVEVQNRQVTRTDKYDAWCPVRGDYDCEWVKAK